MRKRHFKKWLAVLTAMVISATAVFTVSGIATNNKAEATSIATYLYCVSFPTGTVMVDGTTLTYSSFCTTFSTGLVSCTLDDVVVYQGSSYADVDFYYSVSGSVRDNPLLVTHVKFEASNALGFYYSNVSMPITICFETSKANSYYYVRYTCTIGDISDCTILLRAFPVKTITTPDTDSIIDDYIASDEYQEILDQKVSEGIADYKKNTDGQFESDVKASTWYKDLESANETLEGSITTLNSTISSLESDLKTANAEKTSLNSQLETAKANYNQAVEDYKAMKAERDKYNQALTELQSKYDDLEADYNALSKEGVSIEQYQNLQRELSEKKEELEKANSDLTTANANLETAKGELETANSRIGELETQVTDLTKERDALQAENNDLKETGDSAGYDRGYQIGYNDGASAAGATWDNLFPSLFGSIAGFFVTTLGGMTIFGFSLWQLLLSVIAVFAIVFIVRAFH